jgi:glycine hydroxymethyltransferase
MIDYSKKELKRQKETLNLIASENYPSKEVLKALSSPLSFKYAEGYVGKRYYAGCEVVDLVEKECIENCKKVFGVEFANVQPHSGSNANLASFFALVPLGEKILAPDLSCGGHLTHGSTASQTSKLWQFRHYGLNKKNELDYKEIEKIAKEFKPKMIIAGTSAYPLLIDWKKFRNIADSVGAILLADIAHLSGLIAGKVIPSCFPFAHLATSTTQKTIRGPRGGIILTNDLELAKKIDKSVFPGLQGGPHIHTILAKNICFKEALSFEFIKYQKQVLKNAKALHESLKKLGVVLWTENTETHLTNLNTVKSFGLNGAEAEKLLEKNGIITNRESVPYDTLPPWQTSGIRVGTPALTTRGMKEKEMKEIAKLIVDVLKGGKNIKKEVKHLCDKIYR